MIELYNEDSLEKLITMEDKSVNIVLCDPPYDFDNKTKELFHEQFIRISRGWIIIFAPPENPWILPAKQYLFWIKPISTKNTSKSYSRFVEQIFIYGDGIWNTNRHWSQYTNVFTDLVDDSSLHPFRKPPSLIERLILNHTNKGDIIFDAFMGSGSICEVSIKLNRNYIGVEKDEQIFNKTKNSLAIKN